jgi:DNA polymerase-3 subunit gamma/tau
VAYTVLARKYRSRTFSEVIGQEPIATTLANAIRLGRIHHGYLFTGTRGVGKTSMARILAKALNCLKSDKPTPEPCLDCESCRAIAEGQDIDVIEIDAASNTGVDNIRELRSNTAYRPARARYKIYIIDEVHMLSTGAFNALLKTLEEPPEHVKFILATTELQKVPATIQSRCQRYVFRNIGPEEVADRLNGIIQAEGAEAEPAVLRRIARLANGSMRDALSILDQLMSISPTKLTAAALDEMLPPAQDEQLLAILQHAAEGRVADVLALADSALNQGRGIEVFAADLIETLRTLMLVRVSGIDAPFADVPSAARDEYDSLSRRFEPSQYVQMITLLEELRRNVRLSGAGRALTDAALVRLAHIGQWSGIEQLLRGLPASPSPHAIENDSEKKKLAPPRQRGELTAPAVPAIQARDPGHSPGGQGLGQASRENDLNGNERGAVLTAASRWAAEVAYAPATDVPGAVPPTVVSSAQSTMAALAEPGRGQARDAASESLRNAAEPAGATALHPADYPPALDYDPGVESRPSQTGGVRPVSRRAASAAERARLQENPWLRQVMEAFDGVITHCEWRDPQPRPQDADVTE